MAVTRDDVVAIAPELDSVADDDARWDAFITDAELFLGGSRLPANRKDAATKYLVAHWMTASVDGEDEAAAETGPLKSVTIGPITKTYDTKGATASASMEDLKSTRYGAMYKSLIRVAGIGVY